MTCLGTEAKLFFVPLEEDEELDTRRTGTLPDHGMIVVLLIPPTP